MKMPMMTCANSTGISAEGSAKLKTLALNSKHITEKDLKKRHQQRLEGIKKALEDTDKDKTEAYEKCVINMYSRIPLIKKLDHEKHSGTDSTEEANPSEERPAEGQ